MSKRSKFGPAIIVLILSLLIPALAVRAQEDILKQLSRAERLYYEADFQSSLDLLLDLRRRLPSGGAKRNEQVTVELYLALVYLGMNENTKAESKMAEVCGADPNYALNPAHYPPKAIALFENAKAACR